MFNHTNTMMTSKVLKFSLFGLLFISLTWASVDLDTSSDVRKHIFQNYDRLSSPKEQTTVEVGLDILRLHVCPHKEIMTTKGWMLMKWSDFRLTWNPADFDGKTSIVIDSDELWIPDLLPYNDFGSNSLIGRGGRAKFSAVVKNDGTVIYVPKFQYETACPIEGVAYPWAGINCSIVIGSWAYDMNSVDIQPVERSEPFSFQYLEEYRIEVLQKTLSRYEKIYPNYSTTEKYPQLKFTVTFKHLAMWKGEALMMP